LRQQLRSDPTRSDWALSELERLHETVDRRASILEQLHAARLDCKRGCKGCCADDLTVFEVEAERIRRDHRSLLLEGDPHPEGACAFLDEQGACRVYESRPYVCRTQGLPLRWMETDIEGRRTEYRDICPLNERPEAPLEALDEEDCWTIGPTESSLAQLQTEFGGGLRRIRLRDLFSGPRGQGSRRSDP
jgi:Fe-S-cluster containining protein